MTILVGAKFNKKLVGSVLSAVLVSSVMAMILILPEVKPAYGAVSVKMGTIPRGACSPTPCIKNYTGVGFQPQALIVFAASDLNNSWQADYLLSLGFSDGTNDRSIASTSDDFQATTLAKRTVSDSHVIRKIWPYSPNAVSHEAEVNKFHGDGFELNWTVVPTGAGLSMHYMAIGGNDIVDATVGTINAPTSTGSFVHNGVGFKPDAIMFLYNRMSGSSTTANAGFGLGFAAANPLSDSSCSQQGALMGVSEDARATSDTARAQRTDRVIYQLNPADTSVDDAEAEFEAFTHDGFVLNWTDLPSDANDKFYYLAIKGGKWHVGTFSQPTTGTPPFDDSVTGVGFQPTGLLLASFNNVAATSIQDHNRISFGAAVSTTSRGNMWSGDTDNVADSIAQSWQGNAKLIRLATEGFLGSNTNNAEADLKSFDSNGFTLTWTTRNDAVAREILYLAFG